MVWWYDDSIIKKEIIGHVFLTWGITQNLDDTDDDSFPGFEKLNEQGIVEDNFAVEDKEDEDNNFKIEESENSDFGNTYLEIENDSEN